MDWNELVRTLGSGETLVAVGSEAELNAMSRYFDLSNEQLRRCDDRRVNSETAAAWRKGIADNLEAPAPK